MLQQLIKNPERLKDLVDEAKDVALLSGLVIRTKEMANSSEVGAILQIFQSFIFNLCIQYTCT